jgi:hypothetical protein
MQLSRNSLKQQYNAPCPESGDAIVYFEKTIESNSSNRQDRMCMSINVWTRPTRNKDGWRMYMCMRTIMSIEFEKYTHLALFSQSSSIVCDVQTGELL